jgi:hypothetical protein
MDPFRLEPAAARADSLAISEAGHYRFRLNVAEGEPPSRSVLIMSRTFTIQ